MAAVLDELGLTALVTSITGLSAVGAAAILAETGDPPAVRDRTAARCRETGTAGSASGLGKRTGSNLGTAPQADSTTMSIRKLDDAVNNT
jgi:transposase